MTSAAKVYIGGVIGAGGLIFAGCMANWSGSDLLQCSVYLVLATLASVAKLRLPGLDGTYSLGSLFVLYGVVHFGLPETLLASCAGVAAGSLFNTKRPSSLVQVLFNIGNVSISVSTCFVVARIWLASGMLQYQPAVIAAAACVYFIVNTVLVSGVLSLLTGKRLREVCSEWYVWSFPYYLIGIALVALLPTAGRVLPGEAWLVLLPLVYLPHFFLGLMQWRSPSSVGGDRPDTSLPRSAKRYVMCVTTFGAILLLAAIFHWESQIPARFVCYLALTVVASMLKIRLPKLEGTISPAFVLVLVAIAQLSLAETTVVAALGGAVQVLWRPARRPILAQVVFNPASLALSAALAHVLSRTALNAWLGESIVGVLVVSTLVMYGANTLMAAAVYALANRKPLTSMWQNWSFWSFPYYMVGAAVCGAMTAICKTAGWSPSLLLLSPMALLYISYRAQVRCAVHRSLQTTS